MSIITTNKRTYFDYEILESFEAGVVIALSLIHLFLKLKRLVKIIAKVN